MKSTCCKLFALICVLLILPAVTGCSSGDFEDDDFQHGGSQDRDFQAGGSQVVDVTSDSIVQELVYVTPTLTPSEAGIRPTNAKTNYGHPVFNNATGYRSTPHPQAFHLYEYAPVDLPPPVTAQRLSALATKFKSEFDRFERDLLRQANLIYSDIAAGIETSEDPIIQALDYAFAEDIERCVTEWSLNRQIVSYASCNFVYFAYRVASGGLLITSLNRNVPYTSQIVSSSDVPAGFELGLSAGGFIAHGPKLYIAYGIQRDPGEYAKIQTSVMTGFDGSGRAYLADQNAVGDQVERNKTALLLEAAINNLIAIRTGAFVF